MTPVEYHTVIYWCNVAAVLLHACNAALVAVLVATDERGVDMVYELVHSTVAWLPAPPPPAAVQSVVFQGNYLTPAVASVEIWISTTAVVAAFSALSVLGQLYWVVDASGYRELLATGSVNFFRYNEYAVSASLMLVLIALQVGIWDWGALVGIASGTCSCMLFGLLADLLMHMGPTQFAGPGAFFVATPKRCALVAHACGWLALAGPMWVVLAEFAAQIPDAPPGVVVIVVVESAIFLFFGLTQLYHILQFPAQSATVELLYVAQSLVSKTLLTWLVYSLVLVERFA